MRRRLPTLAIPLAAFACAAPPVGYRSEDDARAAEAVELLEGDPVRFEVEGWPLVAAPAARARFASRLFDRAIELAEEARRESFPDDPARREALRQRAARMRDTLVSLGPDAATELVHEMGGSGYRALTAAELLPRLEPATLDGAMVAALESSDPQLVRAGIRALRASGGVRRHEAALIARLDAPLWTVRREAAATLAADGTVASTAALVRAVDDPNLLVAREAARALGQRRVRGAVDALLRFLERAKEANDPVAIESALSAFQALSGRTDVGSDLATWRQWVSQNRPIETQPASAPAPAAERPVASAPAETKNPPPPSSNPAPHPR